MYSNTTLIQQNMVSSGNGRMGSATQVRRSMAQTYWKARLHAALRMAWARLQGRRQHPLTLAEMTSNQQIVARRHLGIQVVPLNQIVGSEGRVNDFDADFRPLKSHNRDRWIGIATARHMGVTLPPVELVRVGTRYFVRDGNHRISVARIAGQTEIDAVVTEWQTA